MDPMTMATLGLMAGGSVLGAFGESEANETNREIGLLNYYAQERARKQAIQEAERNWRDRQKLMGESKLGTTDELGNRRHFVPGVGWVTDLSAESEGDLDQRQGVARAQLEEQMRVLGEDLPLRRSQMKSNFDRQNTEGVVASGLLNEFKNTTKQDPSVLENVIYGRKARNINEAFDSTASSAMRTGLRTGASNSGRIMADIASKRARELEDAGDEAYVTSRSQSENDFNSRRGNVANLYNAFATSSSRMPDASFAPMSVNTTGQAGGSTEALMSQFGNFANNNGARELMAAYGQTGGQMGKVDPNMGWANAFASMAGATDAYGSGRKAEDELAEMRRRYNVNY